MQDYDVENQFELGDLAEESDEDRKRTSFDEGTRAPNGVPSAGGVRIKRETIRTKTLDR